MPAGKTEEGRAKDKRHFMALINSLITISSILIVCFLSTISYSQSNDSEDVDINLENPSAPQTTLSSGHGCLDLSVGMSIPLGNGSDLLSKGVTFSIIPNISITENAFVGIIVQYDNWSVDQDGVLNYLETTLGPKPDSTPFSASGATSYMYLAPTVRIRSNNRIGPIVYGGFSLGYYFGDATLHTKIGATITNSDTNVSYPGFSFYGGFLIPVNTSFGISLCANYNVIISQPENAMYLDPKLCMIFIF